MIKLTFEKYNVHFLDPVISTLRFYTKKIQKKNNNTTNNTQCKNSFTTILKNQKQAAKSSFL